MRAWVAPKGPSITLSNRLYGFAPITNRFASVILRAGRLQLQFVGSGDTSHLDDPGAIPEIAPNFDLPQDAAVEAGRVETADFCIPVPTVSSRHAMFAVGSESEVMVTDLGSTNGTFINGEQLEPNKGEKLSLGSIVTLGDPSLASFKLVELED